VLSRKIDFFSDAIENYIVEKILEIKEFKDGKRSYKIKWKGWDIKDSTWEPEENLSSLDPLVKKQLLKNLKARSRYQPRHSVNVWPKKNRFGSETPIQRKHWHLIYQTDQLNPEDFLKKKIEEAKSLLRIKQFICLKESLKTHVYVEFEKKEGIPLEFFKWSKWQPKLLSDAKSSRKICEVWREVEYPTEEKIFTKPKLDLQTLTLGREKHQKKRIEETKDLEEKDADKLIKELMSLI